MTSRFSYEAPGFLRCAWYAVFSDWRERWRAWITDHERGERFQLSEDEELMMTVLSENMDAVYDPRRVPFLIRFLRVKEVWTPQRIDLAKDRVLTAISDRRHGNPEEWDRLKAMTPQEWIAWLGTIVEN